MMIIHYSLSGSGSLGRFVLIVFVEQAEEEEGVGLAVSALQKRQRQRSWGEAGEAGPLGVTLWKYIVMFV